MNSDERRSSVILPRIPNIFNLEGLGPPPTYPNSSSDRRISCNSLFVMPHSSAAASSTCASTAANWYEAQNTDRRTETDQA